MNWNKDAHKVNTETANNSKFHSIFEQIMNFNFLFFFYYFMDLNGNRLRFIGDDKQQWEILLQLTIQNTIDKFNW